MMPANNIAPSITALNVTIKYVALLLNYYNLYDQIKLPQTSDAESKETA